MTDRQQRNDRIVNSLRSAVNDGRLGLDDVPGLIKKVLRARMWCDRVISQTGERARFDSFAAFAEAQPLGLTHYLLKRSVCNPIVMQVLLTAMLCEQLQKSYVFIPNTLLSCFCFNLLNIPPSLV